MNTKSIGWIGTGVMGSSMCKHVMSKGNFKAFVHNRSKDKAARLVDLGATWCDSPREVAERSDVVFTIVGFPKDVEEIYLGKDGIVAGARAGAILVDMTTSEPSLAKRIHGQAHAAGKGILVLDAPVSGGDVGAKNAALAIMAGGDKEAFDALLPVFQLMGDKEKIGYFGPAGAGQHVKMSNQILIASTMIGVVESMLYAQKAGLDQSGMINIIGKGAAGCWSLTNYGPRIIKGDFNPGFFIKHFVKDMGIALDEARRMNLSLPGLALANQFYVSAMAQGLENLGTQGLYKVLASMNGIKT